jgi:Ni2+-binding GTPase involved in maturation of urease and hydrogenase
MIIQGGHGSGKTVLATSMIKVLQKETGKPKGKIGKIEASALNQKDAAALLEKVRGGCLIIENAGNLSEKVASQLSNLLEEDRSGIFVIIEDTRRGIEKVLAKDAGFTARFSEKITIPVFTIDELVEFAKSYANELGYTIDEMGVLALYNSISNIQKLDKATTLTEVKDIVDKAIAHAEKGGLKKAFSIIASRRYDEEDYVILHEKDFGF